jgi:hypothetical protein
MKCEDSEDNIKIDIKELVYQSGNCIGMVRTETCREDLVNTVLTFLNP